MIDRKKASQFNLIQSTRQGDGVHALFVDSMPAQGFEHWIVDTACINALNDNAALATTINPVAAYSGLFLCPPNTPPPLPGVGTQAIMLPDDSDGFFWIQAGGVGERFNGAALSAFKRFIVPPLWFVRAVIDEGAPAPAREQIQILMTVYRERACGQ